MADGIDMSLDDIIKRSTSSAAVRRLPYIPGPERRFSVRNPARPMPYYIPQGRQVWRESMAPEMVLNDGASAETGTKLYISNLDYGVSSEDIKLLFSEEGELKRHCIHHDKSGRSKGTAEVVFTRHSDALAAIQRYNNMRLDGKPLKIELVGTSLVTSPVMPLYQNSLLGRPDDFIASEQGKVGGSRFYNGFARGPLPRGHREEKGRIRTVSFRDLDHGSERYHHRPRGHTEVKGHIPKVSVRDLDEDLERYHLEAMQIKKKLESEIMIDS